MINVSREGQQYTNNYGNSPAINNFSYEIIKSEDSSMLSPLKTAYDMNQPYSTSTFPFVQSFPCVQSFYNCNNAYLSNLPYTSSSSYYSNAYGAVNSSIEHVWSSADVKPVIPAANQSCSSSTSSRAAQDACGGGCKDEKYLQRRQKNNLAAKKCRDNKKAKSQELQAMVTRYELENEALQHKIEAVKRNIAELKMQISP